MTPSRLLVASAVLLTGAARAQGPPTSDGPPGAADSVMVAVAVALDRTGPEVSQIWPGYWPAHQAFALSDILNTGDVVVVVPREAAPGGVLADYEPVADVPRALSGRTFVRRGGLPGEEPGSGSIPGESVGIGTAAGYVEPVWILSGQSKPLASQVHLVTHEAFHVWQDESGFAETDSVTGLVPVEFLADTTFAGDPGVLARVEQENGVLLRVAGASDPDTVRTLLRRYLALRGARLADRPDLARVERHYERTEGTAEYVGCQAIGAVVSVARVRSCLTSELGADAEGDHEMRGGVLGYLTRWRLYSVGAVLYDALERLGVDDWRGRVARGERLEALVASAAGD